MHSTPPEPAPGTPTTSALTPGAGGAPRPLRRQRDCDLATSYDLSALDCRGVPYEILETDGQATVLRFTTANLQRLSRALGHRGVCSHQT